MSFIPEKPESKKFVNNFLKLESGIPVTIQILDTEVTPKYQHWVKTPDKPRGFPVICLGYNDCPICLRNRSLGENAQKHPNYIPYQKRYMVNVVDLTLCKKDSFGNVYYGIPDENGKLVFPSIDSSGKSLEEVAAQPVNEVKILERGPKLFEEKLKPYAQGTVTDSDENPLKITQFPILLSPEGQGKEMEIGTTPKPGSKYTINPNDYQDKKFDLSALGLRFSAEEIDALISGAQLSDVLAARKAQQELAKTDLNDKLNEIGF